MMFPKCAVLSGLLFAGLAVVSCQSQPTNVVQPSNVAPPASAAPASTNAPQRPVRGRIGRPGDSVPPLALKEWIKGKPVRIQPGTNLFVVVFCNLTQASDMALTNLSALENMYRDKGLITIAVSPEDPEVLKTFVQFKGAEIDFTVAADDVPGRSARAYQQTFGQMMLPRAYLVGKDTKLIWHGHPLTDGLGEVVDEVVSGRYDPVQLRRALLTREQLEGYVFMARQDSPNVPKIGQLILRLHTNNAAVLCQLASKIATDPGIQKRDVPLATAALDRAGQLATTNATDIAVIRAELLYQTGQPQEGLKRAKEALAAAPNQDAKDEVQTVIQAMEAALAPASTNRVASPPGKP